MSEIEYPTTDPTRDDEPVPCWHYSVEKRTPYNRTARGLEDNGVETWACSDCGEPMYPVPADPIVMEIVGLLDPETAFD